MIELDEVARQIQKDKGIKGQIAASIQLSMGQGHWGVLVKDLRDPTEEFNELIRRDKPQEAQITEWKGSLEKWLIGRGMVPS